MKMPRAAWREVHNTMEQYRIIDFHAHPRYDFHLENHGVDITDDLFRRDLEANGITVACGSVISASMQGKELSAYEAGLCASQRLRAV